MTTVEHYGGRVTIKYGPDTHPHLFKPRMHPQQQAQSTQDVLDWLQPLYPKTYWGVEQFYYMRIMFDNKDDAMMFKLVFA